MKKMRELGLLMLNGESGGYNGAFKARFKAIGKKAMKELAVLLELKEHDVSFNPGGIAVSGDLTLMGMWDEGTGVYVTMNKDFPNKPWGDVLFRTIKDMRDFTGGPNQYFRFNLLQFPEALKEEVFMKLRRRVE